MILEVIAWTVIGTLSTVAVVFLLLAWRVWRAEKLAQLEESD
jgi:hypothetical protein